MKRLLISALGIALTFQAGSAFAYQDTGFDPDDRVAMGFDPDIRSTTRFVWRDDQGLRWSKIRFTAYEPLGLYWFVTVRLDSRGGPRLDYIMRLANADQSGRGCSIYPRGKPAQFVRGSFWQGGVAARCRVPLSFVHRTKRIRWKLRSPSGYSGDVDVAPNGGGFYPSP
jgi:hypothetical protein